VPVEAIEVRLHALRPPRLQHRIGTREATREAQVRETHREPVRFPREPFAHAHARRRRATVELGVAARGIVEDRIRLAHRETVLVDQHRHFAEQRCGAKFLGTLFARQVEVDRTLLVRHAHQAQRERDLVAVAGFTVDVQDRRHVRRRC